MSQYGESLMYDSNRENTYSLFVKYFDNPLMVKIKDINSYSMYMCRINTSLGIEFRYIIAFIRQNNLPIRSTCQFKELEWISLQTRSMTDEHNINRHMYVPDKNSELNKKIEIVSKTEKSYIYNVEDFPLSVTLLTVKSGLNEYRDSGMLVTAIETYNTIITWK